MQIGERYISPTNFMGELKTTIEFATATEELRNPLQNALEKVTKRFERDAVSVVMELDVAEAICFVAHSLPQRWVIVYRQRMAKAALAVYELKKEALCDIAPIDFEKAVTHATHFICRIGFSSLISTDLREPVVSPLREMIDKRLDKLHQDVRRADAYRALRDIVRKKIETLATADLS
jgi:hypothetical protein